MSAAERVRSAALPVGVAIVVLAIMWPTMMPGVGFWDTAEFQTVPPILGTMHPTGYPTYVLLGFIANLLLTPLGEPAFRMNVLSLIAVVTATVVAAWLVRSLTGRAVIAAAIGIGLALTPVTWAIATRADAHAVHLAFVAVLLGLLVRWEAARAAGEGHAGRWLVIAAVVYGLAAGNHSLTLLLALPIALYVVSVQPAIMREPRLVAACLVAAISTLALVYLELPLRAGPFRASLVYAAPETWDGFWYIALAEQFRGVLHDPLGDLPAKLGTLAAIAQKQLGPFALAVPVGFLATLGRAPRFALLTGSALVITILFNASYSNADIDRYYLGPVLFAWLWLGVLAATIADQVGFARDVAGPAALIGPRPRRLEVIVSGVLAAALLVPTVAAFPARSVIQDRSSDTSARRWLDAILDAVPPESVVVSWWSYSTTLWYGQRVEGRRADILIVDDRTRLDLDFGEVPDVIDRFLPSRPVYVMRASGHDLAPLIRRYELEALPGDTLRNVYRVIGLKEPAG